MAKPVLLYSIFTSFLLLSRASSFTLSGCRTSKYCMTFPEGCDPYSPECLFFSWILNGNVFDMELSGGIGDGNTYVAVAFGQAGTMQDADLYYCTGNSLERGIIRAEYTPPFKLKVNDESGITIKSARTINSVAECSFSRAANISGIITTGSKDFDLTAEPYYILIAQGNIISGSMQYHGPNRVISLYRINMATPIGTTRPSTTSYTIIQWNGRESQSLLTTSIVGEATWRFLTFPQDCKHGSPECYVFAWNYDSDTAKFNMEIVGGEGNGNTYVGIAFGSRDRMQDADLYICTGQSLESGVITYRNNPPTKLNSKIGIANATATTTNGVARCTFTKDVSVTKTVTYGPETFNLLENGYYILLAHGALSNGRLTYHGYAGRVVSYAPIMMGPETERITTIQPIVIGFALLSIAIVVVVLSYFLS